MSTTPCIPIFNSGSARDASDTIRRRKMRALAAYHTIRVAEGLPNTAEMKQGSVSAEQKLLTKLGGCSCAADDS